MLERLLKESLNAFKFIQHRLNMFQLGWKRGANNKIERMFKQILKPHISRRGILFI